MTRMRCSHCGHYVERDPSGNLPRQCPQCKLVGGSWVSGPVTSVSTSNETATSLTGVVTPIDHT